jgi:hypothetical protein
MLWNFVIIISPFVAVVLPWHIYYLKMVYFWRNMSQWSLYYLYIYIYILDIVHLVGIKTNTLTEMHGMKKFRLNATLGFVYVFFNNNCISVPDSSSLLHRCGSLNLTWTNPFCIRLRKNGPVVGIQLFWRICYGYEPYSRGTVELPATSRVYEVGKFSFVF